MKTYNVKCPYCGTENKGLYLEETNGWMECEHCGKSTKAMDFRECVRIPVIDMDKPALHIIHA